MTLSQVRAYALALPEATEEPHFDRVSFRVRAKIFATARSTEPYIHVFVDELERNHAVNRYPEHMEKLWWGKKVVGLRVKLETAPVAAVKKLLLKAWLMKAPASLAMNRAVHRRDGRS
jgi:hypothetical protein